MGAIAYDPKWNSPEYVPAKVVGPVAPPAVNPSAWPPARPPVPSVSTNCPMMEPEVSCALAQSVAVTEFPRIFPTKVPQFLTLTVPSKAIQGDIANDTAQITSLQGEVSALQSQVSQLNANMSLQSNTTELSSTTIFVSGSNDSKAVSFNAAYAGYVVVSMSSISDIRNVGADVLVQFGSSVIHHMGVST